MARSATVTGSDSGIGNATAVELARAGYDVGITWHEDEQGAAATAEEVRQLNRRAEVRRFDLTHPATGGRLPSAGTTGATRSRSTSTAPFSARSARHAAW